VSTANVEQTFLNEPNVYVSNTRVVIYGTTYSTANITSVRKHYTPARNGCAIVLIVLGAFWLLGALAMAFGSNSGDNEAAGLVVALMVVVVGIVWFRLAKATYHVMLATAAGERQGLSSQDGAQVDRVTAAIAEAIIFRG
jgi:hypothetical protein